MDIGAFFTPIADTVRSLISGEFGAAGFEFSL